MDINVAKVFVAIRSPLPTPAFEFPKFLKKLAKVPRDPESGSTSWVHMLTKPSVQPPPPPTYYGKFPTQIDALDMALLMRLRFYVQGDESVHKFVGPMLLVEYNALCRLC